MIAQVFEEATWHLRKPAIEWKPYKYSQNPWQSLRKPFFIEFFVYLCGFRTSANSICSSVSPVVKLPDPNISWDVGVYHLPQGGYPLFYTVPVGKFNPLFVPVVCAQERAHTSVAAMLHSGVVEAHALRWSPLDRRPMLGLNLPSLRPPYLDLILESRLFSTLLSLKRTPFEAFGILEHSFPKTQTPQLAEIRLDYNDYALLVPVVTLS